METLTDLLADAAHRRGDAPAVHRADRSGGSLSYRQLQSDSRALAAGLAARGYRRGDALGVWLPTIPEWLVAQFAAAQLGLKVAALNTRYRTSELAGILATVRARGVLLPASFLDIDFQGILREACGGTLPGEDGGAPDLPALRDVVLVGGHPAGNPTGADAFDVMLRDEGDVDVTGRPGDVTNVFGTSGTTGAPKLAGHRQAAIVRHARNDARAFDVDERSILLCALPLSGVFGFNWALTGVAAGASLVLQPAFDPGQAAELIDRHGVTHVCGADNMLFPLLDLDGFDGGTWQRGGFAAFTGKPQQLVRRAEDRFGVRLVGLYGASELFALLSIRSPEDPVERRALGGGRPVDPDIRVRAADPQTGRVLDHDEVGELQFTGYTVTVGYERNEEATRAAFTDDGWYRSGDLGSTQPDGSFTYLSRLKDSLRLRGFLVDAVEIEEQVNHHPDVAFTQVVGVPGAEGDRAVAFVLPRQGADLDVDGVRAYCRERMANYKVPAHFEVVETFPTVQGPNGEKIQKHRLRERAVELLALGPVG